MKIVRIARASCLVALLIGFAALRADADQNAPSAPADAAAVASESRQTSEDAAEKPLAPSFRIGFWEIDLLAIDHEARGRTVRFMDFEIFRLFEIGSGPSYHSFSLLEMPDLLNLFTFRAEDSTAEARLVDLQMIDLALLRRLAEAEDEQQLSVLRLPVIGPLYGLERKPDLETQIHLFVFRREQER